MEHALHPSKNPLVPTIIDIMDPKTVQVCLYDYKHDVLLVSESKDLCNKERLFCIGYSFSLWLTTCINKDYTYEIGLNNTTSSVTSMISLLQALMMGSTFAPLLK